MNILFLSLLDFSDINDRNIYTDLLREFLKNEHSVYIVSPIERRKRRKSEFIRQERLVILKPLIGDIQKTNLITKGISTLKLEPIILSGIKNEFKNIKFDLVLYTTPPITFDKIISYIKKRDGAKSYLLLKDIFPQNAVDLNMFSNKSPLYYYFRYKEKKLYRISDIIGCMSKANVDYILKSNPYIVEKTVEVCPNSIEPMNINVTKDEKKVVRERYNIPIDKTVFIYGGNLGKPQGIYFLTECIKLNEDNGESFIVIVGSGTEFRKLKSFFDREKPKNSKLLNQLPKNDYELLANSCDVGLIFLDKRFTIPNFPSRILSYMQASMPVLAATDVNTDIGDVITEGKFGYWCESGNLEKFNELVNKLCEKTLRVELGDNARRHLEEHYTAKNSYEIIMDHFT